MAEKVLEELTREARVELGRDQVDEDLLQETIPRRIEKFAEQNRLPETMVSAVMEKAKPLIKAEMKPPHETVYMRNRQFGRALLHSIFPQ